MSENDKLAVQAARKRLLIAQGEMYRVGIVHARANVGYALRPESLLQGVVEIIRCIVCIRQGEWPSREHDVEEVDVEKLKEMVPVKDEDIAALDKFVVTQAPEHPAQA